MLHPAAVDSASADLSWAPAPIQDASKLVDVLRLTSSSAAFAGSAWFPAGFCRLRPGRYAAVEEFVFPTGDVFFDDFLIDPDTLVYVYAGRGRRDLSAPDGSPSRSPAAQWGLGPLESWPEDADGFDRHFWARPASAWRGTSHARGFWGLSTSDAGLEVAP